MMNDITILLSKQEKLWMMGCEPSESNPVPIRLITLLGKAGYILSDKFQGMISPDDEERILSALVPYLTEKYGLGKKWKTVWETPDELPESTETQRIIQSGLYMNPSLLREIQESKQPVPEFWSTNNWDPKVILEPGYNSDLSKLSTSLLSSPLPLGSEDKEILRYLIEVDRGLVVIPPQIPVKENLSMVLSMGVGENLISGVTDILRVAAYLSGSQDLSKTSRIKLPGEGRRIVLGLLERYLGRKEMRWCLQDAKRYKELWKIISGSCHPSKKRYPRAYYFFGEIQRNSPIMVRGWFSKLQKSYDNRDYRGVLELLSQRPSEFLRRYDSLLRVALKDGDTKRFDDIQKTFMGISGVPGKVLFELYKYFDRRNVEIPRSFLDKAGIRRTYDSLPAIPQEFIDIAKATIIQTIREGWKKKSTYQGKKVYLDLPDLELSLSLRTGVSDKTEPMYPGQKIHFPTTGIIRFFSQWEDPCGVEDLDLHSWLVDEEGKLTTISWNTTFGVENSFVTHSGDIRHQPGDCAEYVTVDYTKNFDYTWMLVTVQNYDGPHLCDVKNWIGISEVTGSQGGKWIPDRSSVLFRGRVTSEAKDMSAFIVNLKEGWARLLLEGVGENILNRPDFIKQYIVPNTLDVKMLLSWYVLDTSGKVVDTPDEADIVLGIEGCDKLLE